MTPAERAAAGLALAAILAGTWLHLSAPIAPFDDAFITFRYVEHLLDGRGAVYNDGQRVLGVSCPLYAAWLALLKAAISTADLPALAVRFNALFHAASALLAGLLVRRAGLGLFAASAAASAIALGEGLLRGSLGGMESPLFLALAFGSMLAVVSRRDVAALGLASLASLTRPEGLFVVAATLGVALLDRDHRPGPSRILLGLAPLLVGAAAAAIYYGSPVPHPVLAKARPLYPLRAGWALRDLLAHAGSWTLGFFQWMPVPIGRVISPLAGAAVTLWAIARMGRLRHGLPAGPRALAASLMLAILIAAYAIGNPLLLPWYYPLAQGPWLVVVLGAALGATGAGRATRAAGLAVAAMVGMTTVIYLHRAVTDGPYSLRQHGALDAAQSAQMRAYAGAARWLEANSSPDDTVAAAEIGLLGFLLDRPILDGCGLVSPEALPFLPAPPAERGRQLGPIPSGLIRSARPEWVVALPAFIHRSLLADPDFVARYALAHEVPFRPDDPLFRAVQIFKRRAQETSHASATSGSIAAAAAPAPAR